MYNNYNVTVFIIVTGMLHYAQLSPDDISSDEGNVGGNTAKKKTPKGKWRPPDRECVVYMYMYNGCITQCIIILHMLYNNYVVSNSSQ